jgi:hypothetical protein
MSWPLSRTPFLAFDEVKDELIDGDGVLPSVAEVL